MLGERFNIVLMGMGEPLHNYDATMKALRILGDPNGLAVSPRRVTLSTVGLVPGLDRLAKEPSMPNLAVSLHATTQATRERLVPTSRKYALEDIIEACRRFPLKRRSRITFEYVLLAGVNDSADDARRLAKLLAGIRFEGEPHRAQRGRRHQLRAARRRRGWTSSRVSSPIAISPSRCAGVGGATSARPAVNSSSRAARSHRPSTWRRCSDLLLADIRIRLDAMNACQGPG